MPYRVKIAHPDFAEPFYWPGHGLEPLDMSQAEALQVVEDCKPLERSLERWAKERGERFTPRKIELDWVRSERPMRASGPRRRSSF
jgi:hypothetical protein